MLLKGRSEMRRPKLVSLRAWINDALLVLTGRVAFQSVITDRSIRRAVAQESAARLSSVAIEKGDAHAGDIDALAAIYKEIENGRRSFKAGETSKAIRETCSAVAPTTFHYRDAPFGDGAGISRNILVAVCDHCDTIVSVPAQSLGETDLGK